MEIDFCHRRDSAVKPDLLVLGGGMAGVAAAARAAESGAEVAIVEKGPGLGGSAALSAGILWTARDFRTLRRIVPGGDPELGRALVDGFEPAVDWIRSAGVFVSERWEGQFGFGSAVRVDMRGLFEAWCSRIELRGHVLLRTAARGLLVDDRGRVCGAWVVGPNGAAAILAQAGLLATGGFQGDPERRASFIGRPADAMLVRSNRWSVGDGFASATKSARQPAAASAASMATSCPARWAAGAKNSSCRSRSTTPATPCSLSANRVPGPC